MFARVFALLPLALLASATHLAARGQEDSCNGGTQACCSQAFSHTIPAVAGQSVVSVIVGAAVAAGVSCSVIDVTTCNQQKVCCYQSPSDAGLIDVSCNNVNLV